MYCLGKVPDACVGNYRENIESEINYRKPAEEVLQELHIHCVDSFVSIRLNVLHVFKVALRK